MIILKTRVKRITSFLHDEPVYGAFVLFAIATWAYGLGLVLRQLFRLIVGQ